MTTTRSDRAVADAEPSVVTDATTATTAAAVVAALAIPTLLAGCGGGGGGAAAAPPPQAIRVTAITVRVTASEAATVRMADPDGAATRSADTGGAVRFALGSDRPADPGCGGAPRTYAFAVTATAADPTHGSAEVAVEVRINDDPVAAADAHPVAVAAIRQLCDRAGLGVSARDLARWQDVPYPQVVERIVAECRGEGVLPPPAWRDEPIPTWQEIEAMTAAQRDALDRRKSERIGELRSSWLREMVLTPSALTERMTLFWHNHFVTASGDLFEPQVTWRYLATLRAHALGSFADLLHAMAREPAMVIFLDSASNVKGRPNENFARELLELFTLGEGQDYGEGDIVALARCFTGWGLGARKTFAFDAAKHDTAAKTLFGQAVDAGGEADGDQALDLILAKDRCARFIVEKLCLEFIGAVPADAAAWATAFKAEGYAIRPLVTRILLSLAFTGAMPGALQRSPVELHVGLWRAVELEPTDYGGEAWMLGEQDQELLDPPNVRGWIGGDAWMSSRTLLRRREFLGWKQWDLLDRVPQRLRAILPRLLFPIPAYDTAALDPATYPNWDRVGGPFRALFVDPAIHLK